MRALLLSLIAAVLVAVIGLGWLTSQVYNQLEKKSENAATQIEPSTLNLSRQLAQFINAQASTLDHNDPNNLLAYWPTHGQIKLTLTPEEEFPLPAPLLEQLHRGEAILLEDQQHLLINYFLPSHKSVLTLAIDNPPQPKRASIVFTLAFYCGLIFIIALWLYPLLRRLILLQACADDFGAGNLQARITASRWSYILPLEAAFNQMAQRVQTLLEDNRLLCRAVSHDLKTPLARLRFGFEMLGEAKNTEQSQRYLNRIDDDISAMENLISRLLDYAKLEEGQIKLYFQPLDLCQLLQRLCKPLLGGEKRLALQLDKKPCVIQADAQYLMMLINNLLSNAQRYAHTQIHISCCHFNGAVELCIEDDGPGIAPQLYQQVLKPFVRGPATSTTASSHGMGLAIVERITAWHKAQLILNKAQGLGGLSVQVRFSQVISAASLINPEAK